MPLPLSASLVLNTLPKDASEALRGVTEVGVPEKGRNFKYPSLLASVLAEILVNLFFFLV